MRDDPKALMLFAAGFGTRMGALTYNRPKPLIEVAGRALLDHALGLAESAAVPTTVVNVHYLAEQIEQHLKDRPNIRLSWERGEILETGGGLRHALPLLGQGPVFTLNSDAVWTGRNPLETLRDHWLPEKMSALLLLARASRIQGYTGQMDFDVDEKGRISRSRQDDGFVYLGAQIIDTGRLSEISDRAFSLNRLWDKLISEGRAYGVEHSGGWCDVGKPESIGKAEAMLRAAHV